MNKLSVLLVVCVLITTTNTELMRWEHSNGCIGNICYRDSSYPHEEIQNMWTKNSKGLSKTFGNLNTRIERTKFNTAATCDLCQSKTNLVVQLVSINEPNGKLYIAPTMKYNPKIKVVVCQNNASCEVPNRPNDFTTSCIQVKSTMSLLVYNSTTKQFLPHIINFPSGCECMFHAS
ncbi:uncharacterized protein LOC130901916 [Diorhabda carinulata]|uniref:uncharacterized protein LOC130901916 n=1 Tax=Diorhabda carinulata TaxID=1163345 RepID=UPI0025A14794|nr:uncharacterized protein LOC130901916 [Diorhabda carinulata]